MICYDAFWKTLSESKESTYTLIKNHHISSSTIDRLRSNKISCSITHRTKIMFFEVNQAPFVRCVCCPHYK